MNARSLLFASLVVPVAIVAGEPAPARAADPDGSGPDCTVTGRGVLEKGVNVYSEKDGGVAIGSFATQEVSVTLSDFPADPTSGRAKIKTGKGSGDVRIEGWIDPQKVPLSAKSDIPVVAGHVWIARGEVLKLKGASPGKLSVQSTIFATQQKLNGKATCTQVAVGGVKADDVDVPSSSNKWVLKSTTLDLLDDVSGSTIFTLEVTSAGSGILLFSLEQKGPFVHVQHFGEPVIDAWAKVADLKLFPKGEMLDTLAPAGTVQIAPAKLKVEGTTTIAHASKEVPIRLAANDVAKVIGAIESDTDVIVVDTIAGWSRIFPKNLEIVPPADKDFWVKASDLGAK